MAYAKKPKTIDAGYLQLRNDLASDTVGRVYIFYGEESYLREFYLGELRKKLVPAGFEEFNYHRLSGAKLTMQELSDAVEAMPMMAERTYVVVTDCDLYRLPLDERAALIALLGDVPEYCCLVFVYDTVDYKPDRDAKELYALLKKVAVPVKFEAQETDVLTNWIRRHFRALGHTIDHAAAEHLIFTCGSLMTGLLPEIEKISAYARHEAITVADIDAVADPILDAMVFEMTNAVTEGNADRAAEVLGKLLKKQEKPVMILAALDKEFRRLYTARLAVEYGKDKLWLMDLWSMTKEYPARKLMELARDTTRARCRDALTLCQQMDRRLKSEKGFDEEGELKLLLMRLCRRS